MSALHHRYALALDTLSYLLQMWTPGVFLLHEHAGTEMHHLEPVFLKSLHETMDTPARTSSTGEKPD